MVQHAQKLTLEVVKFPGFPKSQPVLPVEARLDSGPAPRFGDTDSWDLTALGKPPNERANIAVFHYDSLPADWNYLVRSFLMVLLNPMDEKLVAAGLHRPEKTPKLKSLRHYFYAIRKIQEWATSRNKTADLTAWVKSDLEDYYDWVRQNYAEHLVYGSEQVFALIDHMGPALPWYFTFEVPKGTTRFPRTEIKTKPIEPQDFWALVHACWTYIDGFAPDILQAQREISAQRQRFDELPVISNPVEFRRRLEKHFRNPAAFIPLHCSNRGPGTQGEINWEGISRILDFRNPHGTSAVSPHMTARYQLVLEALDRGLPTRYGTIKHQPVSIADQNGRSQPWCLGFDSTYVAFEATKLRAACFIFIATMSMMRLSEVSALQSGALTTYYGAPAVKSKVYKHQRGTGLPGYWWVSEPVAKAVNIAEKLAGEQGLLFRSSKYQNRIMDHKEEIQRFIEWVNTVGPQRGLRKIADPNISAHRLRRTMAIITAAQPDGEIALGITLKHNATRALANSVTSGYGAPSVAWERELGREKDSATAAELIADWSKHRQGQLEVRGPGAHQYLQLLESMERKNSLKASRGDERMLRELLRDDASGITLGTLNHCLGDPEKAECLKGLDEQAKQAGPIMAACSPTRCRNSVITNEHLPVWLAEEDELKKLLRDRRMADTHRAQLEHQLKDVQRVTRTSRNANE